MIPLGTKEASMCTLGLKWNIGEYETETMGALGFGSFISTSNEVVGEAVRIITNEPVFWCSARAASKE